MIFHSVVWKCSNCVEVINMKPKQNCSPFQTFNHLTFENMNPSALAMMISVYVIVIFFVTYFFIKIVKKSNKNRQ